MIKITLKENGVEIDFSSKGINAPQPLGFIGVVPISDFLELYKEAERVRNDIDPSDLIKQQALLRDLAKLKRLNAKLSQKEIELLNLKQAAKPKKEVRRNPNDYTIT